MPDLGPNWIFVFWVALALPGYALMRLCDPEAPRDGALSTIARAYLASFALLTPVNVIGYWKHLPIKVLSDTLEVLVAVSVPYVLFVWARDLWRRKFRPPSLLGCLCFGLVLGDMWLSSRVGGAVAGDAGFHVARVRKLLLLGFNNWDPIIAGHHYDPIYHTNLYSALMASCAQLARVSAIDVWLLTWPWAKLVSTAAAYHFTMALFRERYLAWVAALASLVYFASYPLVLYPNTLAPNWPLLMGMAFGLDIWSGERAGRNAAWLAAAALTLAQIHMLYAVFLAVIVGPALVSRAIVHARRKLGGVRVLVLAVCALGASGPWLLAPVLPRIVAVAQPNGPAAAAPQKQAAAKRPRAEPIKLDRGFVLTRWGGIMSDPGRFFDLDNRAAQALLLLVVLLVFARTSRLCGLAAMCVPVALLLYFPPLCGFLIRMAGAQWVVARLNVFFILIPMALVPAGVFVLLARWVTTRWLNAMLQVGAVGWGFYYGFIQGVDGAPYARIQYTNDALVLPAATRTGDRSKTDKPPETRIAYRLKTMHERADWFAKFVRPGSTLAAPLDLDYNIPMYCDCYVLGVSHSRGSRGVDMAARRNDITTLFARGTTPRMRLAILRLYKVNQVYTNARSARDFTYGMRSRITLSQYDDGFRLVGIDTGFRE